MIGLSVVVVTYNSESAISGCVRAIATHLPDAEIVIVDNGSDDATVELARADATVRIVSGQGNVGFGAGVNLGAQAARGTVLLVLNPDAQVVAVDSGQLSGLLREQAIGVIGCRVRDPRLRDRHLKFAAWGWRAEMIWTLSEHFLVPREANLSRPRTRSRKRRHWIAGAAFLVSRHEFLELGGFDRGFFLYYEDFDLCRTYGARQLPIRTTDSITVTHLGGGSSPRDPYMMAGYALLGLIEYTAKWHGSHEAHRAAAACFRFLGLIEVTGRLLRYVPIVGPRAQRKQAGAIAVRSWLMAAVERGSLDGTYPEARAAVRLAMTDRTRRHPAVLD
jgi:GT2 family glycosyltransferase